MVGFYRLSGGKEKYVATLCEVVVVGREFVGKPIIQAFKTFKLNYYLHSDTCCICCILYTNAVTVSLLPDCSACPVSCDDFNGCSSCPTETWLPDCKISTAINSLVILRCLLIICGTYRQVMTVHWNLLSGSSEFHL